MREVELLSAAGQITAVFLSPPLARLIAADDPAHLAIFPGQTV
jgi:hypothetical protein